MQKGFVECVDCRAWSDIPEKFNESIHFAQCPLCKKPMYLMRGMSASEGGLRESAKVVAGLISQKGA